MEMPTLSERQRSLLRELIAYYIEQGKPISSRALTRSAFRHLSTATVRNIMADLEDMGLIRAPHTSAGRVPTVEGYRLFVDSLITYQHMNDAEVAEWAERSEGLAQQQLLQQASSFISALTGMTGIVRVPAVTARAFEHIDFLPLSDNRVLVVLVIKGGDVQNRIIQTTTAYDRDTLQQITNYLNNTFAGKDLYAVRETVLRELRQARDNMDTLMQHAIEMAGKSLSPDSWSPADSEVFISGEARLLNHDDLADMHKLRNLFETFTRKREILDLLDRSINADGIQIFIGHESGYDIFDDCSVISATYNAGGVRGALAVVGPQRMDYNSVVPMVALTAKTLETLLKKQQ